jgi:phosphate starvation-inducible membrane PsiE
MFLIIMKERYVIFKAQFATQEESYYNNLIHGILTVFSYTFDHLASSIRA